MRIVGKVKFRRFHKNDASVVSEIVKYNDLIVASKSYSPRVVSLWINERSSPEYILEKSIRRDCFVAERGKKILGYINLKGNIIKMLFVNVAFHGKGIGRSLVNRIEIIAKNNGYKKLICKSNINSEKFYKSIGFRRVRVIHKKDNGIKIKKILMEKQIK